MENSDRQDYIKTSKFSKKINRRNTDNNTHNNIVDDNILEIIPYKLSPSKYTLSLFLSMMTLGVLWIFTKINLKLYLRLNCEPCEIKEADMFIIVDKDKDFHCITALKENFFSKNILLHHLMTTTQKKGKQEIKPTEESKLKEEDSPYIGDLKTKENLVIYFRQNKYILDESTEIFEPLSMGFNKYSNMEIHNKFGQGLSNINDYNFLLNKFNLNIIDLKTKSFLQIFCGQLMHPFYLYQIFSIVIWIVTVYYIFCIIVIVSALTILIFNSYQNYKSYKNILDYSKNSNARIIRSEGSEDYEMAEKLQMFMNETQYIVPGDLIELEKSDTIPCDCILLDGFCTVNESDLTGESSLVMKSPLPYNQDKFDFTCNYKSILFNGTIINKCESPLNDGKIRALVINTGFNTQRGDLIQNILFPKPTNFKFYKDILAFLIGIIIIYFFFIYLFLYLNGEKLTSKEKFLECLDMLTIIFPPSLPICMTFSSYYFQYSLKKNNVTCLNDLRMNAAGRVNILVLDKTGTLTEEGLELQGFQTTLLKKNESGNAVEFDQIEKSTKTYNYIHKEFYKKFCRERILPKILNTSNPSSNDDMDILGPIRDDYLTDYKFNIVYFLECLATCQSIDKLNKNYFGNNVDMKIFENLKWDQFRWDEKEVTGFEKSDVVSVDTHKRRSNTLHIRKQSTTLLKYYMIPKNVHKITEDAFFAHINLIRNDPYQQFKEYRLGIIRRFDFSSKYQAMSVISHNEFDDTYRFFIKGSPERIFQMCVPESIPANFHDQLMEHTQNGMRVLACATKVIEKSSKHSTTSKREDFEFQLTFLGFVIFTNKLKPDTKLVISKLNQSQCKLVIATGDNPLTTISVAKECEFIKKNSLSFFIEYEGNLKFSFLGKRDDCPADYDFISSIDEKVAMKLNNNITARTDRKLLDKDTSINNSSVLIPSKTNQAPKRTEIPDMTGFLQLWSGKTSNDRKDWVICISGKAFSHVKTKVQNLQEPGNSLSKKEEYIKLLEIINKHGKLFYRMSPINKVELVDFYKENRDNIVSMCGDGANDCGAMLSSDVGIAIKSKEGTNITSHFYYKDESITCVESIIKNGRACFETTIIIFEYMLLYAIIQLNGKLVLYSCDSDFNDNQYLFCDLAIVFAMSLLTSKTNANMKTMKDRPHQRILNMKFTFSLIGQLIIQVGFMYIFIFLLIKKWIPNDESLPDPTLPQDDTHLGVYNSYVFLFSCFQYSSTLFALNYYAKHKKGVFSNKSYILYNSWVSFYLFTLITVSSFNDYAGAGIVFINAKNVNIVHSQLCKLIILFTSIANFVVTMMYENLIQTLFKHY